MRLEGWPMWASLRHPNLTLKIAALGAGSAIVTAAVLIALVLWQSSQYDRLAQNEVNKLIGADLDHIAQGVTNLVQTANDAAQSRVDANLGIARHVLQKSGPVSESKDLVQWKCVDQATDTSLDLRLPKMLVGGKWLGKISDTTAESPIVDEASRLVGEPVTIFQRMNAAGDMLRVATTVTDGRGKRAIGTYIPAVNPDGTPNPVIREVLEGKTYHGLAFVINAWYLTAYEPIKDRNGNIVGMLYVGMKQEKVSAQVRKAILQTTVGITGYVYVLKGKGYDRGHYVISQEGERDGEDIWNAVDSDNRHVIQEIIKKAVMLGPGELATETYRWQNSGESTPRWKIARLAYYEPWDWVIGTSVYLDELQQYERVLTTGRHRMTTTMTIAGLIFAFMIGILGSILAWQTSLPVRQMTAAVQTIVGGNLDQTVAVRSHDEIGNLARAFNAMTSRLKQTIEGLHSSEEKYRSIHENALEGIFQSTLEGTLLSANPMMARIFGFDSPEEMLASVRDIGRQLYVHPEERKTLIGILLEKGVVHEYEAEMRLKNGGSRWISISVHHVRDRYGNPYCIEGFVTDCSERKKTEDDLRRLNRELRALSKCNLTLLRATDEQSLLDQVCSIVCEEVGYRMAWVGYVVHDEAKTVRPVAWAGAEDGYVTSANITWADTQRGRGPVGTAIRTGSTVYTRDFETDPKMAPWREAALARGYRSLISVPIRDEDQNTFGALNIYSGIPNAFTPDEIRLVEELAGNLAFGITSLRARVERKQAEEHVRASLEEKNLLLKEIHHRVKNNMQVIMSLLNLQSMKIADQKMNEVFTDSQNRIRSMALIHELLYHSGVFGSVDFLEYCDTLVHRLYRLYEVRGIELDVSGERLILNLDQAIPCGLILNELVSNAMKHAFPSGRTGRISVQIKSEDGSCHLIVRDDGVGLPDDLDLEKSTSIGMQVLSSLAEQIDGTLTTISGPGVTATLTFRMTRT
jgi:PAS domain S-box-containing protein